MYQNAKLYPKSKELSIVFQLKIVIKVKSYNYSNKIYNQYRLYELFKLNGLDLDHNCKKNNILYLEAKIYI